MSDGNEVTSLEEDLRYLFTLDRVERAPDGTFTLFAPRDSGRSIFGVSASRMLEIVQAKWGKPT